MSKANTNSVAGQNVAEGTRPIASPSERGPLHENIANPFGSESSFEATGQFPKLSGIETATDSGVLDGCVAPKTMRIERSGYKTVVVPLYTDRTYVFGRSPDCLFIFNSDSVSRRHGQLSWDSLNRWVYRDLNSTNGTYLLQQPAPQSVDPRTAGRLLQSKADRAMKPGFTILLGDGKSRVSFLNEMPAATAGKSPISSASQKIDASIEVCARHQLPVFLLGASGSGKTFVARAIHDRSKVRGQFVRINCGALPHDSTRLHSELLGHVKGAYTGAVGANIGKFQAAENGTLFLDEVESLPPVAQDFLLDMLERAGASFAPLGAPPGETFVPPNFRLISASKKALNASGLRRDLCHRLVVGDIIELPTLESRAADIPDLVARFLAEISERYQFRSRITDDAVRYLQEAEWPGQVRELEGTIQAVATREFAKREKEADTVEVVIGLDALKSYMAAKASAVGDAAPALPKPSAAGVSTSTSVKRPKDLTADDIRRALDQCHGNKTHAAKLLRVATNTLKARMRALGLGS